MQQKHYFYITSLIASLFILSSCSNTRYLGEGESLFIGADVQITDSNLVKKDRKNLEDELEEAIRPRPNSSFLGLRFKLYIYNVVGEPKSEKGLRNWLRDKIGEPPVLGTDINIETNNSILENYLNNIGYLGAFSIGEKITENKKTKAEFEVSTGVQTLIRNVTFDSSKQFSIYEDIRKTKRGTFLQTGKPYNLEIAKAERERISENLKNIGYYYFNPDHILILADTGIGDNKMDLKVQLKLNEMPSEAFNRYKINDVVIQSNYRLNATNQRRPSRPVDTIFYEDFKLIDRNRTFKPAVFYQAMQLSPGEYYNKKDQNMALNRLVTLGTFRFVKNEFSVVRNTDEHLLDVSYLLTPAPRKGFNIELGGYGQDDSRIGSRASITWRNRNFFKGAELFTIRATGGFEAQYGGESQRPNSYNLGLESSLNIPRFIVPFINIKPSGMFIPRTLINLNYNYSLRAKHYNINTYTASFGYNWKEDVAKDHKLFPINISYVRTDTLRQDADMDANLSNLIYNGLIIGPTYEYTYNSQLKRTRKNNFYFFGSADLAGNVLGMVQGTSLDKPDEQIFGSTYAQYVKLQTDFRYYRNFTDQSVLAARLFLGYGYAYGNSAHLPNIKQFYSGGSNSLRGFSSRMVGPGTYHEQTDRGTSTFIEMLGDIKLEANLEWRMELYSFLKGALFVDAGNIWLLREHEDFPGGKFTNNFYNELAVNSGFGLRFDFSILILRLDLGVPIRKPWLPEGDRWQFDFKVGDPTWRKQNLFLNIAIGYPF